MSKPLSGVIAGIFLISGTTLPASAQQFENRSIEVRYGDLDLSSPTGKARLDRRIRKAATEICGSPDLRDLKMAELARQCRIRTIANTRPQVAQLIEAAAKSQLVSSRTTAMKMERR